MDNYFSSTIKYCAHNSGIFRLSHFDPRPSNSCIEIWNSIMVKKSSQAMNVQQKTILRRPHHDS